MDGDTLQKIISYAIKFLFIVLGILVLLSIVAIELNKKSPEEIEKYLAEHRPQASRPKKEGLPDPWPPQMNVYYPDFSLVDQDGVTFNLSDLKGRLIILELVDMGSPLSQAYEGAGEKGAYGGPEQKVDPNTASFGALLSKFTDGALTLPHQDIVIVSFLIKNEKGDQPTLDDAAKWAAHFGLGKNVNHVVAISKQDFRGWQSDKILPGFQLIDKNFLLRVDSAGPEPKHNLSMTLIPLVPKLLQP